MSRKKTAKRRTNGKSADPEDIYLRAPTWDEMQYARRIMRTHSNRQALNQLLQATGQRKGLPKPDPLAGTAMLFGSLVPSDGTESALARLMVAGTNAAMDCFARAASEDPAARYIELNLGSKLALTVAALSKALDSHRGPNQPDFIHEPVVMPSPLEQRRRRVRSAETAKEEADVTDGE